ncbi:MAG: DNA mismatch repair endonuclease MutL [Bacteroidetes bacterium]|nr:DNA mismatch repair endonuclease MutL [Bacteroidota bacterium]
MPDIINLLPEKITNQIAAGEVVQRPASVVKELFENSIDAGADKIQLIIKDGGTTFIQIKDNGTGMSDTDARMCWERHATSKIKLAEDLFKILTFGFRGEALASIASVSQVEMKTKRHNETLGTEIKIEAGDLKYQEPVNTSSGTVITVKNLFFNIPARKNFLKSQNIESRHIFDEFYRVAIPNPDIEFEFFNNDNEILKLPKSDLKTRIMNVLGKNSKGELLPVNENTEIIKISGFVGSPEMAKKQRGEQYFFVNGRFIKEPYFNHAVQTAFEGLIPSDCYPFYVLFFEIAPSKIDVNVHPTKTEVKFEDSKYIYSILLSVIRKSIGKYTITPEIDDNRIFNFETQTNNEQELISKFTDFRAKTTFNPFSTEIKTGRKQKFDKFYEGFNTDLNEIFNSQKIEIGKNESHEQKLFENEIQIEFDNFFQLHGGFIIASKSDELYIINQQSAHERILYEKFSKQNNSQNIAIQTLLFPRISEFNNADFELVYSLLDEIKILGFDISPFGKNTFIINGVPTVNDKSNPQVSLEGLIENYKINEQKPEISKRENLALSMSKNASIKMNEILDKSEIEELLKDLFLCEQPNYLPNGKPIFIKFNKNNLLDFLTKRF